MESTSTYQAMQAVAPGRLELVRKPIRDPGLGEVRVRVEACGVCHSDAGTRGRYVSNRLAAGARP
jgi:alcohol dehydrogenase, propanol-preferring